MTNHFTANPDDRYWGQDRRHKYDAPLNPIIAKQKPWKVTLETRSDSYIDQKARALNQYKAALKSHLKNASGMRKKHNER